MYHELRKRGTRRSRAFCTLIMLVLSATLLARPALADDYPSRPVRIIIGFSPGAAADTPARMLAQKFSQRFGQQFIVENRPGAGSNIAADFVARAPKDGYTLLMATAANTQNVSILPNLTFDFARDFAPIALVSSAPNILVAHPSLGVDTMAQLIALARQKPGEIMFGSSGVGTSTHLAGDLINVMAGVKLVHVPYPGSAQSITDVLTGRIPLVFVPASAAMQYVEKGDLKALASTGLKRASIAPNVPTMSEAGLPGFDLGLWFGLMAPAGTPREVIDKLALATNEALASPDVAAVLRAQGQDPLGGSPEDFARYIDSEIKKGKVLAEAAGLKK
jgi:tripartite-type tricarboxylate transporter receptor subunit TctC